MTILQSAQLVDAFGESGPGMKIIRGVAMLAAGDFTEDYPAGGLDNETTILVSYGALGFNPAVAGFLRGEAISATQFRIRSSNAADVNQVRYIVIP